MADETNADVRAASVHMRCEAAWLGGGAARHSLKKTGKLCGKFENLVN